MSKKGGSLAIHRTVWELKRRGKKRFFQPGGRGENIKACPFAVLRFIQREV